MLEPIYDYTISCTDGMDYTFSSKTAVILEPYTNTNAVISFQDLDGALQQFYVNKIISLRRIQRTPQ